MRGVRQIARVVQSIQFIQSIQFTPRARGLQLRRRLGLVFILGVMTFGLTVGWVPAAMGQLSLPIQSDSVNLPQGVQRMGAIETAPVRLENRELFRVVALTVSDRGSPEGRTPVEVRAETIEANLRQVIAFAPTPASEVDSEYVTVFDPDSFRMETQIVNNQITLVAVDDFRPEPQEILTVTDLDARYHRVTPEELARNWESILNDRLSRILLARQPEVFQQRREEAVGIAVSILVVSAALWLLQNWIGIRRKDLKAQMVAEAAQTQTKANTLNAPSRAAHRLDFISAIQSQFSLEGRLSWSESIRWLLVWGQMLLWVGGIIWILRLFPETEIIAEGLLRLPIALLLILFLLGFVNRLGDIIINRFSDAWRQNELFAFEDNQRRSLRISTIIRATKGLKTFFIYAFGVGGVLSYAGVPISSVLTLGAVVAFAVSLASQSLIKDLVNGFLILCEDQYAIGDWIAIGDVDGLVENMNLRITQVRNVEGRLITIPNSLISQVENLTRSWSRTDFRIAVAYDSNIPEALRIIEQVAQEMYADPEWGRVLIKPPMIIGVDAVSHEGVVLRVWIDTQPLQQWPAGREFRLRVRLAFGEHGIKIGMPQQIVWHRYEQDNQQNQQDGSTAESAIVLPHDYLPRDYLTPDRAHPNQAHPDTANSNPADPSDDQFPRDSVHFRSANYPARASESDQHLRKPSN
ncbi:mechanosensitive ion channel family protein [Egbenema bharatensis]|uniref:mechanosensitive ion channel family protein n=1 Tax=Egbenema bharatensis TaxID=3463334 RepID=UPI003A887996